MSLVSSSPQQRRHGLNGSPALHQLKPHAPACRPTTLLTRAARALVLPRLARLSGGSVVIVDADGEHVCGDCQASAQQAAPHRLVVADPRFYACVARRGSLGAGEAYMHGYWHSDDIVGLLRYFARNLSALGGVERPWSRALAAARRIAANVRPNTRGRSRRNILAHYDLSNEFFAQFLDRTMTYSSGIFDRDDSSHKQSALEHASLAKYERLARKLELSPGDRVVEVGCGWGGFAEFAAQRFGCHVTGVTLSQAQYDYGRRRIKSAGLTDRVDIRLCDYRDLAGQYDKLVSIEMIEAVGHAQLPTYFAKCCSLLKPDGLMALQAITIPDQRYARYRRSIDFIQTYIFPGGHLPSLGAMAAAVARGTDFRVLHVEDFAEDYARTLLAWRTAFFAAEERIAALGFGPEFRRAWDYYFSSCAAGFYERQIGVCQMVLARPERK